MLEERAAAEPPRDEPEDGPTADLDRIRRILVGAEQERLEELGAELEANRLTAASLAEHLPEAIALRGARDQQIGRALAPTVETALRESIRRNPREVATAIFPVLGPAIRKAIAETMAGLVRSINSALEHSFTPQGIRWRIESWRSGVPYAQIVIRHALVYRVEQVFLVHADTGLLLEHATASGLEVPDADLVSGMLTAIQDFVRDSFRPGEGAVLRTFTVGEHTVQVEAGPLALLALVIRGQAPESVQRKQQDVLETLHVQFGTQLEEFSGDASPFAPARPLLEECLETVVDTHAGRSPSRHAWLGWALPVVALGVLLTVLSWRSRSRFERAVAVLDSEPGLMVVRAEREAGRWRIVGLRDPLARRPVDVLAVSGLDSTRLEGTWESYVSLDSAIVVARARGLLALPQSTDVKLRGDTLVLGGELPIAVLQVAERPGIVTGVAAIDVSGARLTLPASLDTLREGLGRDRVLFAPGSADLSAEESGRLRIVARRMTELVSGVVERGGVVQVSLVGRTDPTGTDETNQALARWRVERVASVLYSLGVPADLVRGEPVATSRPLPAGSPAERSRINRSVSFEITVGARAAPEGGIQ